MAAQDPVFVLPINNAFGHDIPAEVGYMFLWDEDMDHSIGLTEYIINEPAMDQVYVPGDNRQMTVVSDKVRNTIKALIHWVIRLHSHNICINGALAMCLFRILNNGSLRGTRALFDLLIPDDGIPRKVQNMASLAQLARNDVYRIQALGGTAEVEDLLHIMANLTPDQYLLIKSHPALKDAMEKSALFVQLYNHLMAMKERNVTLVTYNVNINNQFQDVMTDMETIINNPPFVNPLPLANPPNPNPPGFGLEWVHNAMNNLFLHQLMRFTRNPGSLNNRIVQFLSSDVKFGDGKLEACLRTRRNGEAHLCQDYCGDEGCGVEEACLAAMEAAIMRIQALRNLPANPLPHNQQSLTALRNVTGAPFLRREAQAIANFIENTLQRYRNSTEEAKAAAVAGARWLAHPRRTIQYVGRASYAVQQTQAQAVAAAAAQRALLQGGRRLQLAAFPLLERNLFTVKDISNMMDLMEP